MASPRKAKQVPATVAVTEVAAFTYSLESVIEATKNEGFVYTCAAFHNPLIESGDVEVNPTLENENGEFATRATAKHLTENTMTQTATPETTTPVVAATVSAKPFFVIKSGEIPTVTRKTGGLRAGRTPIYPFNSLGVSQYFFVPDSGEKSAATSMASTVSGANLRYAEVIEGQTRVNRKGITVAATRQLRKFKAFDTVEVIDGVEVKGAKVFRMPLELEEVAA